MLAWIAAGEVCRRITTSALVRVPPVSWLGNGASRTSWGRGLGRLACVDPVPERLYLGGRPCAVAGHPPASQGGDDGVSVIGDVGMIEEIEGAPHRVAVFGPEDVVAHLALRRPLGLRLVLSRLPECGSACRVAGAMFIS